jgi:hypothetical protein
MKKITCIIFGLMFLLNIVTFIILNLEFAWTGNIKFKLINSLKNGYIKKKHTILNVPLNKKTCKENLEILAKILNDNNITFWLSEGTALGAIRQGDFIDYDDDVDIGIWYKDYDKFKKLIPLIKKNDMTIDFSFSDNKNNPFLTISRKWEKIDIDFTGKNMGCNACKTSTAKCENCNLMLKYLNNMNYIDFLGNKYLCPDINYLEYLYGSDWDIPLNKK